MKKLSCPALEFSQNVMQVIAVNQTIVSSCTQTILLSQAIVHLLNWWGVNYLGP